MSVRPPFTPEPCVLDDGVVRLEPLAAEHAPALVTAGADPEIFRHLADGPFLEHDAAAAFIERALADARTGTSVPFAILRRTPGASGGTGATDTTDDAFALVGSTRYLAIRRPHRGLEIGWTWLSRDVWGTDVNPRAKRLLLRHAFETLGAERVEFKTDARNERSLRAMAWLGTTREGTLRHHMRRRDGTWRDSVYTSIVASEWPDVARKLDERCGDTLDGDALAQDA